MTTDPLLWPIVVCVFSILFAPTLLFATTLLEHLIASPELNREVLRRQKADVPIKRKGKVRQMSLLIFLLVVFLIALVAGWGWRAARGRR